MNSFQLASVSYYNIFRLAANSMLPKPNYQRQFRRVFVALGAPTFGQSHPSQSPLDNYLVNIYCNNQITGKECQVQHSLDRTKEIKDKIQGNKGLQNNNYYYKQNIQLTREEIYLKSQAVQQLYEDFSSIQNVIHTIKNGYQALLEQQPVFNQQNMLIIQNSLRHIYQKLIRYNAEQENQKAMIRGLPKQNHNFTFRKTDDDEFFKILNQKENQLNLEANNLKEQMDELKKRVGPLTGKIKACWDFLAGSRLKQSKFNGLIFYFDLRFIATSIDVTMKCLRD